MAQPEAQSSKSDQNRQSVDIGPLIDQLTQTIAANPNDSAAYRSRGLQHGRNGDYDQAIRDFDRAISLSPDDARAHGLRGMAWQRKNDHKRAVADFDRAIELNPDNASIYATHRQRSLPIETTGKRLSPNDSPKTHPTGAFNLLLNPFVLLGIAPSATAPEIKRAYEDAVEDGIASNEDLQRAQQILLTPRLRVDAEIGGFLDVSPAVTKQIVSELKRGTSYGAIAERLPSLPALSRSNVLAHLSSGTATSVDGLIQLLAAQATIAIGALVEAINEARSEAGSAKVERPAVTDAIEKLLEQQTKAVVEKFVEGPDFATQFVEFVKRVLEKGDPSEIKQLDRFVRLYSQAISPELSRRREKVVAACDAVRTDPKNRDVVDQIAQTLHSWNQIERPAQLFESYMNREEPQARDLAKRDVALLHIADSLQLKWSRALSLNGNALDVARRTLRFEDGTGGSRGLPGSVADALVRYVNSCPYKIRPEGPLFLNQRGRRLMLPVLHRAMRKWRREAGLDDNLTARSFRGAKIVDLLREGKSDKEVRSLAAVCQTSHFRNSFDEIPIAPERVSKGVDHVTQTLTQGISVIAVSGEALNRPASLARSSNRQKKPRPKTQKNKRPTRDPDILQFLAQEKVTSVCVSSLRAFDAYLAKVGLRAIDFRLSDLNEYVAHKAATCRKATIHQYCVALCKFYEDLFRSGRIETLPTVGLDRPGAITHKPRAADPALVRRWIVAVEERIAREGGSEPMFLRVAALIPLFALEDADFDQVRRLTAEGVRNGSELPANFQSHTKAVLRRLANGECTGTYLFPNREDTAPALRQSIAKWIEHAAPLLRLPKVNPRTLMQCRRLLFLEATEDVNLAAISAGIGPQNLSYAIEIAPLVQ